MASTLQTQTVSAPGFKGLNSQDASADLPEGFALAASNCIIDKYGRIGARKGTIAVNSQTIGKITYIGEVRDKTIVATDTSFYVDGVPLYATVPGHETKGAVTAQAINGPDFLIMVSSLDTPKVFDGTTVAPLAISSYPPALDAVTFRPSTIMAGFGRLWVAGPQNGNVVYFSDTLNPLNWATGSSGKLDLTTMVGEDTITGLVQHNNYLVIFLRNNILLYSGAGVPSTLALADTINGLGCTARYSIQRTGEDVIFLSRTGVRSLNRVIQEKSAPLSDLSSNVRDELMLAIAGSSLSSIRSVYSPENSFYLLCIPEAGITYCFDTRIKGMWRATTWTLAPTALMCSRAGVLNIATGGGLQIYGGVNDNGASFRMVYATSWITAQQAQTVKMLKKISTVIVGGAGATVAVKIAWDYNAYSQAHQLRIPGGSPALFGKALFNTVKYASGAAIASSAINVGGAGKALQLTLETDVFTQPISIQTLGLYMKVGKTL